MSYSTGKNIENARGKAMKMLVLEKKPVSVVVDRFAIQEECTGNYYLESEPLKRMDDKILSYIDYCNYHRIHLGISYRAPAEMLHRL